MGVGGQRHAPAALPRERPSTHCIGGWVGPSAGLGGSRKSHPPPGFDPRTVQPVAFIMDKKLNYFIFPCIIEDRGDNNGKTSSQ